ncbi:unnamed protein product [Meganyctiphanes norvegica]|uniref:Vitelline membrane outer layer protein 1 homolog n=1 Tax=Meganyctiphanes norvegica TaxID=48144 RepID=A0AAV2R0Z0_MEGNR
MLPWWKLAAIIVTALIEVHSSDAEVKYIPLAVDWAMNWGAWGETEYCPEGAFAYAFRIKVEATAAKDDTALNGIELFCRFPSDIGQDGAMPRKNAWEATINSSTQKWGYWRGKRECREGYLTGLRLKSERNRGLYIDDTAANELEMQCNWSGKGKLKGGGTHWGKFSSWETCPKGWAICGIQTQVEPHMDYIYDDTALNNVRMFCCDLGPNYYIYY